MNPPFNRESMRLTDSEFRMFAELVRSYAGLDFTEESRFILERRINRRLQALELESVAAYHYRLRDSSLGGGEIALLIDELTTNETYFFRECNQLRALIHEIFEELRVERVRTRDNPISVWCAGCSSGEEPYSIAIMAREAGLRPGVDLHIYASDISTKMLSKARKGVYREASFRETDPLLRDKYFVEKNQTWRISDELKRDVDFIHLNLMDRSKISLLGTMDVILCRNVIIYFDMTTKCNIIQMFYEKMRPGGHLLLGHSESLINLSTSFELRHLRNDLVYRRPLPGMAPTNPWHLAAEAAIATTDEPGLSE